MRGNVKKGKGKEREVEAEPLLSSSSSSSLSSSTIPRFPDTSITAMDDVTNQPYESKEPMSKEQAALKVDTAPSQPPHTIREYERLFGVDEDVYEQPTTTRKELWSYYLYYNGTTLMYFDVDPIHRLTNIATSGDNGVGPGSYSQTLYVLCARTLEYQDHSTDILELSVGIKWRRVPARH